MAFSLLWASTTDLAEECLHLNTLSQHTRRTKMFYFFLVTDLIKLNGHSFKFQGNFLDPVGTGLALVALKEAQPEKTPG